MREDQRSTYYIGGIALNTGNYLWNPDIIFINLDGEFNPETRNETYLLIPDRSEARTLSKVDFKTSIFRNKSINLNTFVNLNQSYFNRELLTNIKSDNKQWGGLLSSNNRFLPFSVSFRKSDWTQKELQTDRTFNMEQNNLLARFSKSFGKSDTHELIYSRDDYAYNYAGSKEISNLINKIALNNSFYFDSEQKYGFISQLSYYDQAGDNEFTRLEAIERLFFNLSANLRFTGGYNYYRLEDSFLNLAQHRLNGSLRHQLYESLSTSVSIDYAGISHTLYNEENLKAGIDLNYTKKIPTGRLNMTYRYYRSYFDMKGESAPIRTINEEHVLTDGEPALLKKPYVDLSTLMVKDQAGIIIYQLNFDYIVAIRNNYVDIQRVPGGQISNNQAVAVDYTAIQPGSYSYLANNNSYSSSILLFKKLIELYYRGSFQDFTRQSETEFITLDNFKQNIFGGRFDIGIGGAGVEYESYESNIIPYERIRYFLDFNMTIRSKFIISLNGDFMDYKLIADDVNQKHYNISGKISYRISNRLKIDLDGGYLSQKGRNIDLDLVTSKLEISSSFRQLFLKGGLEMYRRDYLKSNFAFIGTFVELVRKF